GLTALSAEFTIGEGELMAHDVPLGCAPDEYDDLISGTCSHLPMLTRDRMPLIKNLLAEMIIIIMYFLIHCFCNQVLLLERRGVNKMISRIIRKILMKDVA
ncbi:hypothetical protein OPI40_027150, partial [Klebsiella pneumoniae]|nr:hypothetical protein [Klebsiella pneumoniae]